MLITPLRKGTGACLFFPVRLCVLGVKKGFTTGDTEEHRESQGKPAGREKLNIACNSIFRFAAALENGPPARAIDCPKLGELRTPTGVAAFTLFSTFRALTLNVRL